MALPFSIQTSGTVFIEEEKTWKSIPCKPLFSSKVSVGELLVHSLSKSPFGIGQISHDDGYEMRNWEMLRYSVRVSLNLRDMGLKEGDILGFAVGNSRHASQLFLGAALNGYPVSTMDPGFAYEDIAHIFGLTEPKVVICDPSNYGQVKLAMQEINNNSPIFVCDGGEGEDNGWTSAMELLKEHPNEKTFVVPSLSDPETLPVFIMCSSGTTGTPKSIPISHASIIFSFQNSILPPSFRIFSFSTFYWMTGVMTMVMAMFSSATRVLVHKPYNPKLCIEILRQRQVNGMICSPPQLHLLDMEGFDSSEFPTLLVLCGGSAISDALLAKFKLPIISGYGCTEGSAISFGDQLTAGVTVKIIDDNGNKLGVNEEGEICVKTVFPFLGYHKNQEATNEVLKEGFLHTGDIGYFDSKGALRVVDRKKEIFKYHNYHVSPTDLEKMLLRLKGVAMATVVGIPDEVFAALPAAVIVAEKGFTLTEQEVHEFAKNNFPDRGLLRGGVFFVNDFPMTASGKVIRRLVTKTTTELYKLNKHLSFDYS